ncbi:MAG: sigma factor, partial [Gemmatimonadota bacterium]
MSALPGDNTEDLRLYLLVLRCQAGDEQAFARLFAWFGPRTLVLLRGMVNDEAEDVQQEVWLSVYRQLSTLSNPRAFRTWLFRTTRHRAIDCLRRQRR